MAKTLHFHFTAPVSHNGDTKPRVHVYFYSIAGGSKHNGTVQHVLQSEWPKYRSYLEAGGWTHREPGTRWFEH